jgi:hydrogenase expression/formation protein HypE
MSERETIRLAHGGGGQLTAELLGEVILPALGGGTTRGLKDAAELDGGEGRLAFTTDSYVIQPLEFPGGDIGKLAVCGTVNDLAVSGARPSALSLALVLEEGLEIAVLRRSLESAAAAAKQAGVEIVTGDTKVVERGGVSGMVWNTAGLGRMLDNVRLGFERIAEGDEIVVSGPPGEHALAVMSCRKGLSFSAELESDCAPLGEPVAALAAALGEDLHWMRDPTRGGVAATLVEASLGAGRDIEIIEDAMPVNRTARAAAEMLGLDLLAAANEGKLLAFVCAGQGERAVRTLQEYDVAARAAVIGRVTRDGDDPLVELVTAIGGRRIVQMPYGEELPRIC